MSLIIQARNHWGTVGDGLSASFFVTFDVCGGLFAFSNIDAEINLNEDEIPVHFRGVITNEISIEETVDIYEKRFNEKSITIEVPHDEFPVLNMRKAGVIFQLIGCSVYWGIVGGGMCLDELHHVYNGIIDSVEYNHKSGMVSIKIDETVLDDEIPFPPVIASTSRIPALNDEFSGKCYPVVIGSVQKMPLMVIDDATPFTSFLVMADPLGEYSGSKPPSYVSALYDGDVSISLIDATDARDTDSEGDGYWKVTGTGSVTSLDVTADVTGHTPATLYETLRYLITQFGDSSIYDFNSLREINALTSLYELNCLFNTRSGGGTVNKIITQRLMQQFPFVMLNSGDKYEFRVIRLNKQTPRVRLSTDTNIVDCKRPPSETPINEIVNQFVVRYGVSGLRGDSTGVIERDHTNNHSCHLSKTRYGKRASREFELPDVYSGAEHIVDYLIDLYSKMRVQVSYTCTLNECSSLQVLDTVTVYDENQEWTDREPHFLVTGITRKIGPFVDIDLLSIDDYFEVYNVNRNW